MTAISYERVEIHSLPSTKHIPLGFWEGRVREIEHPELKALFVLPNREEATRFVAEKILELVKNKPDAAITWPSGYLGNDVIDEAVRLAKERDIPFDKVHICDQGEDLPIDLALFPIGSDEQPDKTILQAKRILYVGVSPEHADDMKQALYGPTDEHNPSSLLRSIGHHVEAVVTQEIANHILA